MIYQMFPYKIILSNKHNVRANKITIERNIRLKVLVADVPPVMFSIPFQSF